MRFDSKLMFSDGQSISGTSGTSTNTLDLNKAGVFPDLHCRHLLRFSADLPAPL